ncbi:MAG TPA: lipid II flippase MurJ [Ignavibacteriaceae bacterium]|nr:lipid II flippase MurJ [Ignavibacteriaceae bacterium]
MNSKQFFKTVAGASLLIILFNLLSRFLGLLREIIFAHNFGVSEEFEIYLITAVFPTVINLILYYLGQNFFIPVYNKTKNEHPESLNSVTQKSVIFFALVALLTALVLEFFSPEIISFYVNSQNPVMQELGLNIFRILLLTIPMTAVVSIIAAYHQARYDFKIPIISQILLNVVFIAVLILFSKDYNIYSITIAFVSATFIQLVYLLFVTPEIFRGTNPKLLFNIREYKGISFSLLIILIIEITGQMYVVFDRYFYEYVNKGGFAVLNYATTVYLLPVAFISASLSLAIFPKISDTYHKKDYNSFNRSINDGFLVLGFILAAFTAVYFFYGDFIIGLFYQRGQFSAVETLRTESLLRILSISLIFYGIYAIIHKVYFVIEKLKPLLYINIAAIGIKFLGNTILVNLYQEMGLALSTIISYSFLFFASITYLLLRKEIIIKPDTLKEFFIVLLNTGISILAAYIFNYFIEPVNVPPSLVGILIFGVVFSVNSYLSGSRIMFLFIENYLPSGLSSKIHNSGGKNE